MRRCGLILALCLIGTLSLAAFDFGVTVDNYSTLNYIDKVEYNQKNKVSLWMNTTIGKLWTFNLTGSYTYSIGNPYFFDVDDFNFSGNIPSKNSRFLIRCQAGRFYHSDFTQKVFSHPADGLLLGFNFPRVQLTLYSAVTVLLFGDSSYIKMSVGDKSDSESDNSLLGPDRMIESVALVWPEIFLNQNLSFSIWAQQDLRPSDELVSEGGEDETEGLGGRYHSFYIGLGLDGAITPILFYDTYFYLSTGLTLSYLPDSNSATSYSYQKALILSYLAGAGLRLYLEKALYSSLGLEFVFAGGDKDNNEDFYGGNRDGKDTLFMPISLGNTGLICSPKLGNLMIIKFNYSFKPFSNTRSQVMRNFQILCSAFVFLRPTTGSTDIYGMNTGSDKRYLATEADLSLNFRPFSDLGTALVFGFFIPNSGDSSAPFLEEDRGFEFMGRLELSLSF